MDKQGQNSFALLQDEEGEDVSKLIKRVAAKAKPWSLVREKKNQKKKKQQPTLVKRDPSPEMLRAKPLVLPDDVLRSQIVLRKRKPGERGQHRGPWWSGLSKNVMSKFGNGTGVNSYQCSSGGKLYENNEEAVVGATYVTEQRKRMNKRGRRRGRGVECEFSEDNVYGKGEIYALVGNQVIEIEVHDGEVKSNLVGEEGKLKADENCEKKVLEEDKNNIVVEEYEKLLLEKKAALEALDEIEKRKLSFEKDMKSIKVQDQEEKKEKGVSVKLNSKKSKKKDSRDKEENTRKHRKHGEVRGRFLCRSGLASMMGMAVGVVAYFFWP